MRVHAPAQGVCRDRRNRAPRRRLLAHRRLPRRPREPGSVRAGRELRRRRRIGVTIQNFKFDPATSAVAAGGSLTWTNKDDSPHTVTFDDASITSSANLSKDQTFAATFASAGTFTYKCSIRPSMTGTITVS